MAGFELSRIGTVGEFAREWRVGRYLPLYAAGIVLGVAAGIGATLDRGVTKTAPTAPTAAEQQVTSPGSNIVTPGLTLTAAAPTLGLAPSIASPVEAGSDAHVVLQPETLFVAPPSPAIVPEPAAPEVPVAPIAAPVIPAPVAVKPAPAPAPVHESAPAAAPVAPAPKSDFYVPAVASGGASGLEQRLFDGINAERAKAGLAPYSYDAGLTKVARTRSQQMADQGYFGHVDPAGYSMYTALLKHFGYTSYAWAGENLAMNNYNVSESAERSVISLMNSPTHRANILAGDFFRIGIGEVTTADGRHIFTMIFLG